MSKGIIQNGGVVEPRANHGKFSVEARAKREESALNRRGTGENLFMNPRGSRENLSNEQLVIQIQAGIDVADNMAQLWQQNKGMVAKLANRYKAHAEFDDLMQEGYMGLCSAVDAWNPDGATFLSYAVFWIKQAMIRYIENCGSSVRIPVHQHERIRKYKKIQQQFLTALNREPTEWELCRLLDVSSNVLQQIKADSQRAKIQSLDKCVGEENDTPLSELLPDQKDVYGDVLDEFQQEELKAVIWPMVDSLPDDQPTVLRMRFQDGKTLKETGNVIGASLEQTRQLQAKAMRTLRMPRYSRILRPFLDDDIIQSYGMSGTGIGTFERTWTSATERAVLQLEEMIEREKAAAYRDDEELAYMENRLEELKKQEIV